MILARKINKILYFYMIFARTMSEFYIKIARKIFSQMLGRGHVRPRLLRLCFKVNLLNGTNQQQASDRRSR